MFSFVGDTVLDPFMGTGTTIVVASRAGRHSIGLEINPTYFQFASDRLHKESRSEEHTSELQSLAYLVCRLLLEKKKKNASDILRSKQQHTRSRHHRLGEHTHTFRARSGKSSHSHRSRTWKQSDTHYCPPCSNLR